MKPDTQNNHSYVYVFIRTDLSLPQQCVQSCHSCIEASKAFHLEKLDDHPSVIILDIKTEAKLTNVRNYLSSVGIKFVSFYEPDRDNELTSIATEPIFEDRRRFFKKFQLIKEPRRQEPISRKTKYAAKFSDGYFVWRGESISGNVQHRTGDIGDADFFDTIDSAKHWTGADETEKVEIQYHIGGAK